MEPITNNTCPICKEKNSKIWKNRSLNRSLRAEDMRITDAGYGQTLTLNKCGKCDFIFAESKEITELVKLYEQLDDPEYENTQAPRALQMCWLLERVLKIRPNSRSWLDIGAGAGILIAEAQRKGLHAIGVEPSHALVAAAHNVNGVQLIQGTFPHPALENQKFDVISLIDVIEHVADPVNLMTKCREALSPNGILIMVTPDVSSIPAKILGQSWWHFRLAHVGYFNRKSITHAAKQAELETITTFRAWWFFRIQYLAERITTYLPITWWNKLMLKIPALAWVYQRVIPLNLYDSWVVVFTHKKYE